MLTLSSLCPICREQKVPEGSSFGLCDGCEAGVKECMMALYDLSGGGKKAVPLDKLDAEVERRKSSR